MKTVSVNASKNYDILIGKGLLPRAGELIRERFSAQKAAVITDDAVNALYGEPLCTALRGAGFETSAFAFLRGEGSKNLSVLGEILEFLAKQELTKSDVLIALGGGVAGDIGGFAAAVYLREIPFVQIPTTFLAAVDSSVGGKTAVNLPAGKNLAGVFCQPSLVICDARTLDTLPAETFADGSAEAVKYGVIADEKLFEKMRSKPAKEDLCDIIADCVTIKADIVSGDEFDNGRRQLLNFGHTLGHAAEKLSGYQLSHGRAVAMGMVIVSRAAFKLGLSNEDCAGAIREALANNGLPTICPYGAKELAAAALHDKKRRGDSLTLIVPTKIGLCRRHDILTAELENFIAAGLEEGGI